MTLSALLFSSQATSQNFGKLFTTPEERQYLDGLRKKFLERSELDGFNIRQDTLPLLEEDSDEDNVEFSLGGVINRKNGGKSVWLNGKSIHEQDLPRNIRLVKKDNQYMLRINTETGVYHVKSGQTLTVETGKIRESYEKAVANKEETSVADSIKNAILGGNRGETGNTETENTKSEKVGIDDVIQALQTIQETSGVN